MVRRPKRASALLDTGLGKETVQTVAGLPGGVQGGHLAITGGRGSHGLHNHRAAVAGGLEQPQNPDAIHQVVFAGQGADVVVLFLPAAGGVGIAQMQIDDPLRVPDGIEQVIIPAAAGVPVDGVKDKSVSS